MSVFVWTGATSGAWNTTTNWSPNGTPGAGDTIILDGRSTQALTGNPTSSPRLALIRQYLNCDFGFGMPAAPIAVGYAVCEVGLPPADGGSGGGAQFHINPGTNDGGMFYSYAGPSSGTSGQEPVTIKTGTPTSGTSHTVNVMGGVVGIATGAAGDVATINIINVTGGICNVGLGVLWSTINQSGIGNGKCNVFVGSSGGTINVYSGTLTTEGVSPIGTINGFGGAIVCNHRIAGGDSITNANFKGAAWDFTGDGSGITLTNSTIRAGSIRAQSPTQIDFGTIAIDMDVKTNLSFSLS